MKVCIGSFIDQSTHCVTKFQTDRFRTFDENRAEKRKRKIVINYNTLAAAITLRTLCRRDRVNKLLAGRMMG